MKLLIPSERYPEKYWLKYDHDKNLDNLEFCKGEWLHNIAQPQKLKVASKVSINAFRKYDYLFSDGVEVIGARLAKILDRLCPVDVQFCPAIVTINGDDYTDYFVVNYLKFEASFDMSRSSYVPLLKSMPEGPKKFREIKLLDIIPKSKIFRAAESRFHIVLSDALAAELEGLQIVGVRFVAHLDGL